MVCQFVREYVVFLKMKKKKKFYAINVLNNLDVKR